MSRIALMPPPDDDPRLAPTKVPNPHESIGKAIDDALAAHEASLGAMRLPWPTLDSLVGSLAPGRVTVLTANTGAGKTTLALGIALEIALSGGAWTYMGTEMPAHEMWRILAATLEGCPAGVATADDWARLTPAHLQRIDSVRRFHEENPVRLWSSDEVRDAVLATEVQLMRKLGPRCQFLDMDRPTPEQVVLAMQAAADRGARLFILDHLGRVDFGDGYDAKKRGTQLLTTMARECGVHLLSIVQQNRDVRKGDHLEPYRPPKLVGLEGGGYIEHEAYTVVGAWRPIRGPNPGEASEEYAKLKRRCEQGDTPPKEILELNTVCLCLLKARGAPPDVTVGDRVRLAVHYGRVTEPRKPA